MATNMTPDTRVLASGRIVHTDERGRAVLATCTWLVDVPTASLYPPEAEWYPDSPADVYTAVDCGAPQYAIDGDPEAGWFCTNGHRHLTYGSPAQQAEERLESFMEFSASTNPALAAALERGESFRDIADRVGPVA